MCLAQGHNTVTGESRTSDPSIPSLTLYQMSHCAHLLLFYYRYKLTYLFCITPVEGVVSGDGLLSDGGSGAPSTGKAAHLKACWKT